MDREAITGQLVDILTSDIYQIYERDAYRATSNTFDQMPVLVENHQGDPFGLAEKIYSEGILW
jgi:hypothetical protein